MLEITVGGDELFNEETEEFFSSDTFVLQLEHSLISVSKWESKWETPFIGNQKKTAEQVLDYVKQMIVGPEPAPEVLQNIRDSHLNAVNTYINAKMTATWINKPKNARGQQEVITAELIYYWMIALAIPFECQDWHLNRLLTLIEVCNIKNSPKKKMNKGEFMAQRRDLNAERKAQLGTTG